MKKQLNPNPKPQVLRSALFLFPLLFVCVIIAFASGQRLTAAPSPKQNPAGLLCTAGWSAGPDMPSTRVRMVGVFFYPNFYVMGGRTMDGAGTDFTHPFEYDPGCNTWTIRSAIYPDNQVSNMACGILTDSGTPYIYCIGGSAGGQTTVTLPGGFAVYNNKLYMLVGSGSILQ